MDDKRERHYVNSYPDNSTPTARPLYIDAYRQITMIYPYQT